MNTQMTTEELRAALREAEQRDKQQGQDELEALPRTYEWSVKQESAHVYRVTRRYDQASVDAFEDWRRRYPKASYGYPHVDMRENHWRGMTYLLIGNYLAQTGGGYLVLKASGNPRDSFSHEPRLLTDEEAAALRALTVPDSLKA